MPSTPADRNLPKMTLRGMWSRFHLGALPAHLMLSLLFTWPLALNFLPGAGTLTPGAIVEDRNQNLWNLWWVREAVLSGHNPFTTEMIWYPTGVSLYYHTLNVFNGLLALPLLGFLSLTTAYNLIVLFSFVMGGWGAFLLVHYVCGDRWAALVGSAVFAYSAYHIATMRGLLQLISLEWVPFFVLFLLQAVFAPAWAGRGDILRWVWRRALPAGVSLLLVSLVDWYYTMYALMLAGLLALYVLARHIREREGFTLLVRKTGAIWLRIGVCLLIYLVLVSPILVPTIRELRAANYMNPASDAALSNSADLLAFFQPSRDNKLWGHLFNRLDWPFGNNLYEVYLSYTALALSAVGIFAGRRTKDEGRRARPELAEGTKDKGRRTKDDILPSSLRTPHSTLRTPSGWFWGGCSLVFFALALGPVLQVNGRQVRGVSMPYALVERLPVLNISRSPDRFVMPLTLCLGVLSGLGTKSLLNARWLPGLHVERKGALLAVGALAAMTLELAPMPYPQVKADIAPLYTEIGREAGDFTIMELPPQDDYWHGAHRMYAQTAHSKRIFGGYISREYPHPFLENTPGYMDLLDLDGEGDMLATGREDWLSAFAQYGTRYVVLQKSRLPRRGEPPVDVGPSRAAIGRVLGEGVQPRWSDEHLEVYPVPTPEAPLPFLSVGAGWEPRESGPNGPFRWMAERASLRIDAPQAVEAFLQFRAAGVGPPRRLQIFHGDFLVFDRSVSALQSYKTEGPLGIPAGVSVLTFVSPEGVISPDELGIGSDPRRLSFAVLDVKLVSEGSGE